MYNFNHLYYFFITAQSGGVTKAAKRLRISQPSLTSQLKTLERALDLKLFEKVGRHNELTESGLVIQRYCDAIFGAAEEMDQFVRKRVPSSTRRIRVGVSHEVDRPFVVEAVGLFLKQQPHDQRPKVTVVAGQYGQLVERLRFKELDAVFSERPMPGSGLVYLSRVEVPVVLACSARLKIPRKLKNLRADLLAAETAAAGLSQWVMPSEKFKLRDETDQFFVHHALEGRIIFESDVMSSVVRSVADDLGVAFLPLLYINNEIQDKSIQVLGPKQGYWKHTIWLVSNPQGEADSLILSLAQTFRKVCGEFADKNESPESRGK